MITQPVRLCVSLKLTLTNKYIVEPNNINLTGGVSDQRVATCIVYPGSFRHHKNRGSSNFIHSQFQID